MLDLFATRIYNNDIESLLHFMKVVNMENSKSEELRLRFHEALDFLHVPARGRVAKVAGKTEYSQGAVSEFLSGKKNITDRFFQIFWRNFDINPDWLTTGKGEISFKKAIDDIYHPTPSGDLEADIRKALLTFPIREALFELGKMSDSKLWRAVAMLKEMNEEQEREKEG